MASYAYTFNSGDGVTPTRLNDARTVSDIVNADIKSDAAIAGSKLEDGAITNAKINASAAIALSKLATGALPTAITVANANLVSATAQSLVPAGAVMPFARTTAPAGWLAANGNTIGSASSGANNASADYSSLFAVLWDNWSNTDLPILTSAGAASTRGASASADFSANKRLPLPDLRGIFVRGSGSQTIGASTYSGTFASKQQDELKGHTHTFSDYYQYPSTAYIAAASGAGAVYVPGMTGASTSGTTNSTGGGETRPANIALLYCIKF